MPPVQFGFTMPADLLDKAQRFTFTEDLNRALELVSGHFDSAWIIDHLQSGDTDMLEGFTTLSYVSALHLQLKFGHTVLWAVHSWHRRWLERRRIPGLWLRIPASQCAGGATRRNAPDHPGDVDSGAGHRGRQVLPGERSSLRTKA